MALFSKTDVEAIRKISSSFNQERFDTFAKEAEDVHLRMMLGDALYADLQANPTDAKYITLLDGEDYLNDGKTIKYFGLKTFLAYAWLYINAVEGDDFQSNIGTVNFNQQNQFTQRPAGKSYTLKKYQDTMVIYRNNAIDYLNEKASTYPLWEGNDKQKRGRFQFISM